MTVTVILPPRPPPLRRLSEAHPRLGIDRDSESESENSEFHFRAHVPSREWMRHSKSSTVCVSLFYVNDIGSTGSRVRTCHSGDSLDSYSESDSDTCMSEFV